MIKSSGVEIGWQEWHCSRGRRRDGFTLSSRLKVSPEFDTNKENVWQIWYVKNMQERIGTHTIRGNRMRYKNASRESARAKRRFGRYTQGFKLCDAVRYRIVGASGDIQDYPTYFLIFEFYRNRVPCNHYDLYILQLCSQLSLYVSITGLLSVCCLYLIYMGSAQILILRKVNTRVADTQNTIEF